MKQKRLLRGATLALAATALLFGGCVHDEVNLKDIDGTANAKLGIGLPVGTMTFKIGDFLGDQDHIVVLDGNDPIDNDNRDVLAYRDTFETSRNFHQIDVKNYFGTNSAIGGANYNLNPTGFPVPVSGDFTNVYPVAMTLSGINDDDASKESERLDYVLVTDAQFTVTLNNTDAPSIKNENVKKVELILDGDFVSAIGQESYELPFTSFGQPMPCEIKDFYLYAMKDRNFSGTSRYAWISNAKQDLEMHIRISLYSGETVLIQPGERLNCVVNVQLLDYSNIYGWFEAGKQVRDSAAYLISQEWDSWDRFKNLNLRLYNPYIKVLIKHQISGYLNVECDYLGVIAKNEDGTLGEARYATYDNSGKLDRSERLQYLPLHFGENDYSVSPIEFSAKTNEGRIDRLFEIRPDSIFYRYKLTNDLMRENDNHQFQMELGKNTDVELQAMITIPFQFKQGMYLNYKDTLSDVDIAQYALDSLIQEYVEGDFIDSVSVKTTDLKLVMTVRDSLPLDVTLKYKLLDKNDKEIVFNDVVAHGVGSDIADEELIKDNTLYLKAATNIGSGADIIAPTLQRVVIKVSQDELNKLAEIDKIVYDATINTNDESFAKGAARMAVKPDQGLQIGIGVSAYADTDLFLNLDF